MENNVSPFRELMTSTPSSLDAFQRLRDFRSLLLRLHRALLHSERIVYEQFHGRIASNTEFFSPGDRA